MSRKKIRLLLLILVSIVFVVSAVRLISIYLEYAESAKSYEIIREDALTLDTESDENGPPKVNFDTLQAINPEIVAWLWIPDTEISYPILCGPDNNKYLKASYDLQYNVLGSIFQDYRNSPNFADLNTVIYGHNTKNGSMFGGLKKFRNKDYAEEHKDVYILTRDATLLYEAFSIYETPAVSDTYTILFASDDTYKSFLKKMRTQSLVSVGTAPETEHIITLSTCTSSAKTNRLVLQARFAEIIPIESERKEIK